jgi:hypothetical protein
LQRTSKALRSLIDCHHIAADDLHDRFDGFRAALLCYNFLYEHTDYQL